jgi:hypothetical protein
MIWPPELSWHTTPLWLWAALQVLLALAAGRQARTRRAALVFAAAAALLLTGLLGSVAALSTVRLLFWDSASWPEQRR